MEKLEKEEEVNFVHIPGYILADRKLTANQKMVFGLLVGFCNSRGYTNVSNEALANRLHMGQRSVAEAIFKLVQLKRINKYTEQISGSLRRRTITIGASAEFTPASAKTAPEPVQELHSDQCENDTGTSAKTALRSNKEINIDLREREEDPPTLDDGLLVHFEKLTADTLRDNLHISSGLRPLKGYPDCWVSLPNLKNVLDTYFNRSGLEPEDVSAALKRIQAKMDLARSEGKKVPREKTYCWLIGWALSEQIEAKSRATRLQREQAYLANANGRAN